MWEYDTNLTWEEAKWILNAADTDGDGVITRQELYYSLKPEGGW